MTAILAFLGAILLWASFPPLDAWPLAWLAPIPWVLLIRRKTLSGRHPYAVLLLAGFCFWMGVLHWLRLPHPATSVGWVALSFYFAFYITAFVALTRLAVHRFGFPLVLAAPLVWTGLELARAHLLTGMTMASLGHTQYRWIELIQISDLTGAYGVSFLVMFTAASLARMLPLKEDGGTPCLPSDVSGSSPGSSSSWNFWPLLGVAVLLGAALLYAHFRLATTGEEEEGPKIALIQGSVDIEMRYNPAMKEQIAREYVELSQEAVAKHPGIDLVVWPETMFLTGVEFNDSLITFAPDAMPPAQFDGSPSEFQQWLPRAAEGSAWKMGQMAKKLGVSLLLGVDRGHFCGDGVTSHNSAAFVGRDGRMQGYYDKMHLVMFGEYVPFARRFPWLQRLTPLPISVTAGERPVAFDLKDVRIAPNICYETVLPHLIRNQVNTLAAEGREPDILVNLTNDGWFWGSSELDLHLVCGVFRAVECRKPLLIAANTGFSAWIDGDGRIQAQGRRRAKDIIVAQPRVDRRWSAYLHYGDWFSGTCLALCGLFGLVGVYHRKKPLMATERNRHVPLQQA
jgi:apolipoprotein N-acyltransferase